MDLVLRRIGNSLGVIVPRAALEGWGLGEGDALRLSKEGIHPPGMRAGSQEGLDEHKRKLAAAVAAAFSPDHIRAHSLGNLHRWKEGGVWVSAYSEWKKILQSRDDGALFAAMLGRDERANRLRQSAPYVGLLDRDALKRLNEEASR